jgi:hypothetical protein
VRARSVLAVLLLAAAVRAPFWAFAARASVDGDTAIVGLMARHPTRGITMWGQPYGSPIDGWIAAPFVAMLGPSPLAVRIPYALLALALVAAAAVLGEIAVAGAGLPAALLVACPSAYVLLLSALPPPLYPTTLALLAAVVALAARAAEDFGAAAPPKRGRLILIGLLSGLAVWTHLMSLATLAAVGVVLARGAGRARARSALLWAIVAFLLASAPWWLSAWREPSATAVLGIAHEGTPPLAHAAMVARRLHEPVAALLGLWSPLTADEGERTVAAPLVVGAALVVAWLAGAMVGWASLRGRPIAGLLLGAIALTTVAFPFPVRSDPHTVRFLTPIVVPLAVLAAAGAVRLAGPARAWLVVIPLCVAHLWTGARLLAEWHRGGPEALVPDCARVLDLLREQHLVRAYASYHTAFCLTYTSGETVVASPPWNERFWGYPMPYLDEVRFTSRVGWVLVPGVDFQLPAMHTFESKLAGIGARYARRDAAPAAVYFDFVPPFASRTASGAVAGPAGDGDVATRVVEPSGSAVFAVSRPLAVAGVTLLAGPSAPDLPRAMDIEVSSDGSTFERVGRRRRGRETMDLAWVNGHPQFLVDDLAFSIGLDGRIVTAVRIAPTESGPWAVAEVLLHPVAAGSESARSSDEGGSWAERRAALAARPDPVDAGWLYRSLLALRHP